MAMAFDPELPIPRLGRHARQAAWRVAAAAAIAALGVLALVRLAPGDAGAIALIAALGAIVLGACHLMAARAADAAEERWLRQVLDDVAARA